MVGWVEGRALLFCDLHHKHCAVVTWNRRNKRDERDCGWQKIFVVCATQTWVFLPTCPLSLLTLKPIMKKSSCRVWFCPVCLPAKKAKGLGRCTGLPLCLALASKSSRAAWQDQPGHSNVAQGLAGWKARPGQLSSISVWPSAREV